MDFGNLNGDPMGNCSYWVFANLLMRRDCNGKACLQPGSFKASQLGLLIDIM